MKQVHTFAA